MTRAQFDQESFISKTIERLFERIPLRALQAQFANKLFESGSGMRKLANMLEYARIREARLDTARVLRHYRNYREPAIVTACSLSPSVLRFPRTEISSSARVTSSRLSRISMKQS